MGLSRLLEQRASENSDQLGYRFLLNDHEELSLTYGELAVRASRSADKIRKHIAPGQRVLLVYHAGLEFIQAIYACFLANVVAVPLPMPRANDLVGRFDHVVKDCEPAAIFTDRRSVEQVRCYVADPYRAAIATLDEELDRVMTCPSSAVADSDAAILQYTSGSTSQPKGVIITHDNLLANLRQIAIAFGHTPESSGVIWLPHYHDMGLVGGILQPLFAGFPVTLFSPISFAQRPLRWLKAIHKYRATTSGGPNFAYGLCAAKADAANELELDLSSWTVAFNGAEPVKASTIDTFSNAFSAMGFRRSAFVPCYGLAEATLLVSSASKTSDPVAIDSNDARISAKDLTLPQRDLFVSCGTPAEGTLVRIIRVGTEELCPDGEIGEIAVRGPSVASGYWGKTDKDFMKGSSCELRTGDFGFRLGGELFVTGRLKDLILIRGKNLFPEDVEAMAALAEPLLDGEGAVAFGVAGDASEELVILQEMKSRTIRALDLEATREAVSRLVMQSHGIEVSAFVAVKAGSLVRTSSGKISRFACKQLYVARGLQELQLEGAEI